MEETRKNYGSDVILSYFWQQAPTPLVQWVSRRHTVFFSNMTSAVSIVLALLLSILLISIYGMGWMTGTTTAFGAFIVLAVMFYYNAQPGRIEARQLIDMWMHRAFDTTMGRATQDIEKFISPSADEKVSTANPLFKVMRVNDVKARNAKNDQRLYYYDKHVVDVVSTTISKKYVEPSHLHTLTTESYYVVTGRLLLNVEGQSIWLNEGDLAVVSPGACHNFETDGEEVKFLAIKKEPGLKDKQVC